jgi:quercetin dioxygenase-like cupin family protein
MPVAFFQYAPACPAYGAAMAYDKVNIADLEDQAPGFGMRGQQARFARQAVGAERIGLAHYRLDPGHRLPFGHRHRSMEELYLVLGGSGRFRVDDDVVDIAVHDVVRVPPEAWRGWEAGPDGLELLAFGEHVDGDGETEMDPSWWPQG